MNIETLKTRIQNGENKLAKLNAKMERINIALNGGSNPYYYSERDQRWTKEEIADLEEKLNDYRIMLEQEMNKESLPKIEVMVRFLQDWREKAYEFYSNEAVALYETYRKHFDIIQKIEAIPWGEERKNANKDERARYKAETERYSQLIVSIRSFKDPYFNEEKLAKILDEEVKRKYDDLVYRVTKVTGEIVDCSNLKIGNNGSINGIVIGKNAKANVETIYAGGYNIQCLHFRVLVHRVK